MKLCWFPLSISNLRQQIPIENLQTKKICLYCFCLWGMKKKIKFYVDFFSASRVHYILYQIYMGIHQYFCYPHFTCNIFLLCDNALFWNQSDFFKPPLCFWKDSILKISHEISKIISSTWRLQREKDLLWSAWQFL